MSLTSDADEPQLVTIRVFTNETQADLAKSALVAFGIDCWIAGDDCGGQRPNLTLTHGLCLVVKTEDAQRAEEVLQPDANETLQS